MPIPNKPRPKIALVASIAWTLWNYRLTLILSLEKAGYQVLLFAHPDETVENLRQHTHAQFFPLHALSRKSLSLGQNIRCWWEMYQALRIHRPDMVLFFTIRPNTLGNLAAAAAGIRSISTVEGMGITTSQGNWLRFVSRTLYRLAFSFTQKVLFLNPDDQKEFVEQGIIQAQKSQLIQGPGLDIQHFKPISKPNQHPFIVFLFVGRLLEEKGIHEFVEAASQLKSQQMPSQFRVLGSPDAGNPTSIAETTIQQWVDSNYIEYLGHQPDVRPALADADVLVLPSYYREGLPRSILEAMAMEKPIITTDSVGCRETVIPGKNGFLIPPRDVPALVQAMQKMAALSREERQEMGRQSRCMVVKKFSDAQVIPTYESLIGQFLPQ